MNIVWFSWKDIKNPAAGGAERVADIMASRLTLDSHSVIMLASAYKGCKKTEKVNGYTVVRGGSIYTVYLYAALYYLKNLRSWAELIVDEVNTMPFFTQFYTNKKRVMLIFQLCRQVWFHEFWKPLGLIGYILEPIYLSSYKSERIVTESESTKRELVSFGFKPSNIRVFPIGITIDEKAEKIDKYSTFTILSLGMIRSMKQTHHHIKAFEIVKKMIPQAKLIVAGLPKGSYGRSVMKSIATSRYSHDIKYLNHVSEARKQHLMRKSHCLVVSSVKEGWGIVVTEAGALGTPSIVYNTDGLRDAVAHGKAGILTKNNTPQGIADEICRLYSNNKKIDMNKLISWHRRFTLDASYNSFKKILFSK